MSDIPPVQTTEVVQVQKTEPFAKRNKKVLIGLGAGLLALVLFLVFLLLINKPANTNATLQNTQTNSQQNNDSHGNGNFIPAEDNKGFENLPENTCPDSYFLENGAVRGDLEGKPYALDSSTDQWVQINCVGKTSGLNGSDNENNENNGNSAPEETDAPLLLKGIGFNLENYNPSTGMAGDIKFTKIPLPFDQICSPYGQQDPRTTDTTKVNPQPTVILPLGTKVLSLVDGIVVEVKELYSGDWTVWVAKSNQSTWFYETEHLINPTVLKGDVVTAGQILGEVSDYDSKNNPGFGLIEIGILHGTSSGEPQHVCPFKYLDPSIKDSVNAKFTNLYAAWEEYIGKDVYDQENYVTPTCVTENPFNG